MHIHRSLKVVAALALAVGACASSAQAVVINAYNLKPAKEDFNITATDAVYGQGVIYSSSSTGQVAGYAYWKSGAPPFGSTFSTNLTRPIIGTYSAGTGYTKSYYNLTTPPPTGTTAFATFGINKDSVAVGTSGGAATITSGHATVWNSGVQTVYSNANGNVTTGPFGLETNSVLYAVNDLGYGVGMVQTSSGNHAAVYDGTGFSVLTATANGNNLANARGIALNSNVLVGTTLGTSTSVRGYIYDYENDTMTTLAVPTGLSASYTMTTATAISPNGRYVVGNAYTATTTLGFGTGEYATGLGSPMSFLYDTLTSSYSIVPTGAGSTATGVNDYGWVVGNVSSPTAFIWSGTRLVYIGGALQDPSVTFINDSSYPAGSAGVTGNFILYSISNDFTITGSAGILPAPSTGTNPVVLKLDAASVPEPTALSLVGIAGLGLTARRRRR